MASKKRRREQPLTLRCLGFCGVDDSVEPALLSAISAQHNWVEWGVLFRPEKAGSPRFASDAWLERLRAVNGSRTMRLAAHLCSRRVNDLLRGDATFVRWLYEHLGFRRVQINATKANGADMKAFASSAAATRCVAALRAAFETLPEVEFILQRNSETKPLWERLLDKPPTNLSLLFDDSKGMGVLAEWPAPPSQDVAFGYAGGLSPSNLKEQLQRISSTAPGRTVWVDMESSLRTTLKDETDVFDVNKAMICVSVVIEHGLAPK